MVVLCASMAMLAWAQRAEAAVRAVGEGAAGAAVIRLLPAAVDASGEVELETLVLDRAVAEVRFYLDGERALRRRFPPFSGKLKLPRSRSTATVRVEALDADGRPLGEDSMELAPRSRRRLAVRLRSIVEAGDELEITARLDLPPGVEVEEIASSVGDSEPVLLEPPPLGEPLTYRLARPPSPAAAQEVVTLRARLADGRVLEDAAVVAPGATSLSERVEVELVQLQVVVTDRQGRPLRDLGAGDLVVRENGEQRAIDRMYLADDVRLVLGLAVDSSGSMATIWEQTEEAAERFLRGTLTGRDQGFVVDFDSEFRLREALTADVDALVRSLEEVEPEGGTTLYDSILFSLLQFERTSGRRGLVVLTDGVDSGSITDPQRTIDFARRLGIPVYVIAFEQRGGGPAAGATRRGRRTPGTPGGFAGGLGGGVAALVQNLRLLTEPSGGRLYRAPSLAVVGRALEQINAELRSQYVVTYYREVDAERRREPEIEVEVPGRKGLVVKTVYRTVP